MEETSAQVPRGRAAILEEKMKMEEFVLQRLLERRTQLSGELESARLKYQRLMERKVLLQERKLHLRAARAKEVALQKELKDSLAKSRDRLASLTSLEEGNMILEEEGSPSIDTEHGSNGEPTQNDLEEVSDTMGETDVSKTIAEESLSDSESGGEAVESGLFTSESDAPTYNDVNDVLKSDRMVDSPRLLLPALQGDLLNNVLMLALREANAADEQNESTRRTLIWNTCLDLCMLSSNTNSPTKAQDTRKQLGTSGIRVDPNLPLCPYELAGVCADDLCPYQHTTKPTLARERIPLPPIAILESMPVRTPVRNAKAQTLRKDEKKMLKKALVLDGGTDQLQEDISNETSSSDSISPDEEFIELPEADPEDDVVDKMEIETKEEMESPLILVGAGCTKRKLWWGGFIDVKWFSIRNILNEMHNELAERQNLDYLSCLGGIIDLMRLALHAGRFDIIMSLNKQCEKYRPQNRPDVQATVQKITTMIVRGRKSGPQSFCKRSFTNQATLSILSHSLESMKNGGVASIFQEAMAFCNSADFHASEKCSSFLHFDVSKFREMLHLEVESGSSVEQRTLAQLKKLKSNLQWARSSGQYIDNERSLQEVDSEILKPCWTAMISWFETLERGNRTWEGIRATILIGEIVLLLVESFAANICDDGLDTNLTAALITVDTTVSQITTGLCEELSDIPMIDVLVSPLFSCNIMISTFLRKYKTSQTRLECLLAAHSQRANKAMILARFSEVLWSQLFQLRMALIVESSKDETNSRKNQPKSKLSKFSWEPSKNVADDNKRLVEIASQLGIRLNHLYLEGDWIGSPFTEQLCSIAPKEWRNAAADALRILFPDSKKAGETVLCLRDVPLTPPDAALIFITKLPSIFLLAGHKMLCVCLAGCELDCLPTSFGIYFPNLTSLDLSDNSLQTLPPSFSSMASLESLLLSFNLLTDLSGEEFVASLKSLDLSRNCLTHISHDFVAAISHRCFQLEEFDLSYNEISGAEELAFLEKVAVPQWTVNLKSLRVMEWLPQRDRRKMITKG